MKRKIPKKLYKYKSFNDENCFFKVNPISGEVSYSDFGLDGLSKGKIWFSHLDNLNDPYESEYDFDYSNYLSSLKLYLSSLPKDSVSRRKLNKKIAEKKKNGWSDRRIIREMESKSSDGGIQTQLNNFIKKLKNDKMSKVGILSLCEDNDNLLMWAYYAKDHKGYCLEFSRDKKHKNCKSLLVSGKTFPVDYDDKHYMIHEDGIGGYYSTCLYERIFDKFGNVLECKNIFYADNSLDIAKFIGNNFKYNSIHDSINITYNQIDKFRFVNALYEYGFCDNYIHYNKLKYPKPLNKDKKEILKKLCGSVSYPISFSKVHEEYKYNKLDNESINKNNTELAKQFIYDCARELTYHQEGLTDKQIADKLLKILNILDDKNIN